VVGRFSKEKKLVCAPCHAIFSRWQVACAPNILVRSNVLKQSCICLLNLLHRIGQSRQWVITIIDLYFSVEDYRNCCILYPFEFPNLSAHTTTKKQTRGKLKLLENICCKISVIY